MYTSHAYKIKTAVLIILNRPKKCAGRWKNKNAVICSHGTIAEEVFCYGFNKELFEMKRSSEIRTRSIITRVLLDASKAIFPSDCLRTRGV
ncbi:hypothetical protein THOM_0959 [Trachipleistophora hominis]|uniref:Uncharacterized protein n=1 Tax=Trachipleistophora hominis TaxID=72359 RepID=L7JYE3_TRAHO|nr:hypothetical protein THOM_0959 [Trachipleistophora hominis]